MRPLFSILVIAALILFSNKHAGAGDKGTVVTLGALKSTAPADWKNQPPSNKLRAYQFAVVDADLAAQFSGYFVQAILVAFRVAHSPRWWNFVVRRRGHRSCGLFSARDMTWFSHSAGFLP